MGNTSLSFATILSFDPGGTTGFAIADVPHKPNVNRASSGTSFCYDYHYRGGQINEVDPFNQEGHHAGLWNFLTKTNPDILVAENFVYQIRRNQGNDQPGVNLMARDYLGVLKLYAELTKKPIHIQPPSVKELEWLKGAKLKSFGVYTEGKPHQNDATRHLIYFIVHVLKRKDFLKVLRKSANV